MGLYRCSGCSTLFRIGLSLWIMPPGKFAAQTLPSDYTMPVAARPPEGARLRARKARIAALRDLSGDGRAEAFPECPLNLWRTGQAINQVVQILPIR